MITPPLFSYYSPFLTKRPRPSSPLNPNISSLSASTSGAASLPERMDHHVVDDDQDLANCLMLLAQGGKSKHKRIDSELLGSTNDKGELCTLYKCKTCDRWFQSFQALGGHRASHKKPKSVKPLTVNEHSDMINNVTNTAFSLRIMSDTTTSSRNKNCFKSKVHECSICRAEFSSGQALGGHMRRHRTFVDAAAATTTITTTDIVGTISSESESSSKESKKERNFMDLDLNLPAPKDDHDHDLNRESKFQFSSKKGRVIVFSASSLLNCH